MRLALALAAAAAMLGVEPGLAACQQRPIGETLSTFRSALDSRLTSSADRLVYIGGEPEDGAIYEAQPSKAGVRLVAGGASALQEIGTDLSEPYSDMDLDALMTVAAFSISRLSAEPEAKVKDALYSDLRNHVSTGDWNHKWGGTVAVTTRTDSGLVVRIFKADCD